MIQATIVDQQIEQLVKIPRQLDLLDHLLVFRQLHPQSFDHYVVRTNKVEDK
jgi:hypothetical protein